MWGEGMQGGEGRAVESVVQGREVLQGLEKQVGEEVGLIGGWG